LFESQVILNPMWYSTGTRTLVFTDRRFYVKEDAGVSVEYKMITSVHRRGFALINPRVTVGYSSSAGPRELSFTAASAAVADEQKNKKIHGFLKTSAGKEQVDVKELSADLEGINKSYWSSRISDLRWMSRYWSGKIETKDEALRAVKESSNAFIFVGAITIVAAFILDMWMIVDGLLFIILALLLRKWKSRVVGVVLLALSTVSIFVTAYNAVYEGVGGRNILLAIIIFLVSVRAVQATFKLHKLGL